MSVGEARVDGDVGAIADVDFTHRGEADAAGGGPVRRGGWPPRAVLAACDLAAGVVSAALVKLVSTSVGGDADDVIPPLALAAAALLLPVLAAAYGLYSRRTVGDHSGVDDLARIAHMGMLAAWTLVIVNRLAGGAVGSVPLLAAVLATFGVAAVVRIPLRSVARAQLIRPETALIAGTGHVAATVAGKLERHPEYGIRVAGFIDLAAPAGAGEGLVPGLVLGRPDDLGEIARATGATRVIVAFSLAHHDQTLQLIAAARREGLGVDIVPRLFESVGPRTGVYAIEGLQLMALPRPSGSRVRMRCKRIVDVAAASAALVAVAPLMLAIAVWIKLDSRGPVFYRHERLTEGGRSFRLFKFRTMHLHFCRGADYGGVAAEEAHERLVQREDVRREFELHHKIAADPRITRAGRVLRPRSLDELPQLINVLRGDLALVGPRPITAEELPRYGHHGRRLLSVRPGVTGYWQTNGRSQVTFDERVRLDMAYVESHSLGLDMRIIAQTLPTLRGDRGAS
jgi:exopolysaccharide biosynthesis polyprenyl glycosylphosphotransferase